MSSPSLPKEVSRDEVPKGYGLDHSSDSPEELYTIESSESESEAPLKPKPVEKIKRPKTRKLIEERYEWQIDDFDPRFHQIGKIIYLNGFFYNPATRKLVGDPLKVLRSRGLQAKCNEIKRIGLPAFRKALEVWFRNCILVANLGFLATTAKSREFTIYRTSGKPFITALPRKGDHYKRETLYPITQTGSQWVFVKHDPSATKPRLYHNDAE